MRSRCRRTAALLGLMLAVIGMGFVTAGALARAAGDAGDAGIDVEADAEGTVELRYRAYLAGAPVGEATVEVMVADGTYQVRGDARSDGWIEGFTRWRNRFSASGVLAGAVKQPVAFSYTETDVDKHRHLVVRNGTLQVTKNGRKRPQRSAPDGSDVVSALFVQPHCGGDHVLHTGRHVYRLTRLEHGRTECRYRVVDDDDDTFDVELRLARRGRLVVPGRITVHGWVTGWVQLVDEPPPHWTHSEPAG